MVALFFPFYICYILSGLKQKCMRNSKHWCTHFILIVAQGHFWALWRIRCSSGGTFFCALFPERCQPGTLCKVLLPPFSPPPPHSCFHYFAFIGTEFHLPFYYPVIQCHDICTLGYQIWFYDSNYLNIISRFCLVCNIKDPCGTPLVNSLY